MQDSRLAVEKGEGKAPYSSRGTADLREKPLESGETRWGNSKNIFPPTPVKQVFYSNKSKDKEMLDSRVILVTPARQVHPRLSWRTNIKNKVLLMALSQSLIWMPVLLKATWGPGFNSKNSMCVPHTDSHTAPTYPKKNIRNSREHRKAVRLSGPGQIGSWGWAEGPSVFIRWPLASSEHLSQGWQDSGTLEFCFPAGEIEWIALSPPRILHDHRSWVLIYNGMYQGKMRCASPF